MKPSPLFLKMSFLTLLLAASGLFIEIRNDRFWMSDLDVYLKAAAHFINGENLYEASDIFYRYKYSPAAALFFTPWLWLPRPVSEVLYWLSIALAACATIYMTATFLTRSVDDRRVSVAVGLATVVFACHIQRELHLGQVNQFLVLCYAVVFLLLREGKTRWAGALLSATLFVKPFGLIFIPYLLLKRQFTVISSLLASAAVLLVSPLLFYSFSDAIE